MSNYFLLVIDENDQIVEKIPADHKTDKQLLKDTEARYQGINCIFKFGNLCTEEQFQEVKDLLNRLNEEHPGLLKEVTDKERPEFRHLGYELSDDYKQLGREFDEFDRKVGE